MTRILSQIMGVLFVLAGHVANADKLSDFQEAVKNEGCNSIPYQATKDLEVRGKLVKEAIYNLEKCIDYRQAVMNVFGSAIDRVRNENDPPEIVPLARQLRDKWEAGKPGHEQQITARKNGLGTCKDSVP